MAARVLGIDHLGVAVRDLSEATTTYGGALGLNLNGNEDLPERGLSVQFVDAGESRIELIAPTRDDSEVSRFLAKHGEGLHHICLQVDDIEAALAGMKARGARLVDEAPKAGAGGSRVAFIHPRSTHGVLIELVEYPPGRRQQGADP